METLITLKSIPESNPWYGNITAGGPTLPTIVEASEYNEQAPMFVHPAEKPQANSQVYRDKLYESKEK